jgi:hypothetical protein
MNSALKTLIKEKHNLELELKIWSDERNFNEDILKKVRHEITEHDQAIEMLTKKLEPSTEPDQIPISELKTFVKVFNQSYRCQDWNENNFFTGLKNWLK